MSTRSRIRRLNSSLLALAVVLPLGCTDQEDALFPQRSERAWATVWADEFDGAPDEGLDPTRWVHEIGRGDNGWGNNELQYYTDAADNVAFTGDGMLAITAREESLDDADYTSARITTEGLFAIHYGRIEARIKLPRGAGIWPAFWMLGEDLHTNGWPTAGEIDIMEYRGQSTDIVQGSLHGPGYYGGNPITDVYLLPEGGFDQDFHVFAVEWDEGRVAWYVDNVLYHVATSSQVPRGGEWVFDHPFFLILNVAVGGNFVGPPSEDTAFPQTMLVDYVRVLQRQL